jgi:hypothetical protein
MFLTKRYTPGRKWHILDFDIENRPLSYLGNDFTTSEVTAIAAGWFPFQETVESRLLGQTELPDILSWFRELWEEADMVTGHYILRHDIPIIQGMLLEFGMRRLEPKMVSDTKVHLKRASGLSVSQENLAYMFEIESPKVGMNTPMWREANRLTPEGIELTRARVEGDVKQHMALRAALLARNLLASPTMLNPNTGRG